MSGDRAAAMIFRCYQAMRLEQYLALGMNPFDAVVAVFPKESSSHASMKAQVCDLHGCWADPETPEKFLRAIDVEEAREKASRSGPYR